MFENVVLDLGVEERQALQTLIEQVQALAPDAVEGRSYGLPAFRYKDKPLLGFSARHSHLSVHPFSSDVVAAVQPLLDDFECSKGTIRFTVHKALPEAVVAQIVRLRMAEI